MTFRYIILLAAGAGKESRVIRTLQSLFTARDSLTELA
jgi:hypothetical protein